MLRSRSAERDTTASSTAAAADQDELLEDVWGQRSVQVAAGKQPVLQLLLIVKSS